MITPETKPTLVASTTRPNPTVHFASGDGRFVTMPYCQTRPGVRPGDLDAAKKVSDRFAASTSGRLMNCHGCAEMIERHPSWRPNHFPLMDVDLRWV